MTQTDIEQHETQRPERAVLVDEVTEPLRREVAVSVSGDGRTLISRLVPYNEVAVVDDGRGPYKERFLPGAFNAQLRAANRIKAFLNFRHSQDIANQIGHAERIDDRPDGLHGELRVLEGANGDTALQLYHAGILDRLSIEFVSRKHRVVDGIVERLDARLLGVALVPEGAYGGAQVLATREEPDLAADIPSDLPDPELIERCRRLGIQIPQRYEAHPAETDTPPEGGPSEDGTGQPTQNTSSKE